MIEINYELITVDSSRARVEMAGEITFTGYDMPVNIELPKEAQKSVIGPIS